MLGINRHLGRSLSFCPRYSYTPSSCTIPTSLFSITALPSEWEDQKKSSNCRNLKAGHFMMTTKVVAATTALGWREREWHGAAKPRVKPPPLPTPSLSAATSFSPSLTGPSRERTWGRNAGEATEGSRERDYHSRQDSGGGRDLNWLLSLRKKVAFSFLSRTSHPPHLVFRIFNFCRATLANK